MSDTIPLAFADRSHYSTATNRFVPEEWLPRELDTLDGHQATLPRIAKDQRLVEVIERELPLIPTRHELVNGDARRLEFLAPESIHLVLTSPPYWTLKEYRAHPDQLGFIESYTEFLDELDRVWAGCYRALVPGGRLICVVGDVCLSRRKNDGSHSVVPLHASIQEHCRNLGFSNLAPIIWHKIANANFEGEAKGGGFLGKPYEPNAVVKNDIEFILMQRKNGGYRSPSFATRILSVVPAHRHRVWFQQIWTGIPGASTRQHPAPYPMELAERLIRMFSFVGDTVLDPFLGTGTTCAAAARWGRNSLGLEVDPTYFELCEARVRAAVEGATAGRVRVRLGEQVCSVSESRATYSVRGRVSMTGNLLSA